MDVFGLSVKRSVLYSDSLLVKSTGMARKRWCPEKWGFGLDFTHVQKQNQPLNAKVGW